MSLEEICAVLKLHGFQRGNELIVREAGIASLTHTSFNRSQLFEIPCGTASTFKKSEAKSAEFVTDRIHGLPLYPTTFEKTRPSKDLETIIQNWYDVERSEEQYLMAYKGGHYEKDLLKRMNIPSINLERFHCPRIEELLSPHPTLSCPFHVKLDEKYHCARKDSLTFQRWILREKFYFP